MVPLSRRTFLRLSSGLAAGYYGFGLPLSFQPNRSQDAAAPRKFNALPRLDGSLSTDSSVLDRAAEDLGQIVHHRPAGVLRPASMRDILATVRFCNAHGMKISMRGQGHCRYGQAQAQEGIVIDTSTLGAVRLINNKIIEAEAGATWAAVADRALAAQRTPRVLPDALVISVGGLLSVGGIGNTSQHFGGVVDNVSELEVVTGDGRLITCSAGRHRELFEMTLAGLGQCALILRARMHLMAAPSRVTLHDLDYSDLQAFIADHRTLLQGRQFDHQDGRVLRDRQGWRFRIQVGKFLAAKAKDASLPSGLQFQSHASRTISYRDYLYRNADAAAAVRGVNLRRPAIVIWVPASAAEHLTREFLESPAHSAGIDAFYYFPVDTRRFKKPLLRMPAEEVAFTLWLFRTTPMDDDAALQALLESNRAILDRVRAAGGKFYSPYAFVRSSSDWRAQYEPELWKRLLEAKERYDPRQVLTPGLTMFPPQAG